MDSRVAALALVGLFGGLPTCFDAALEPASVQAAPAPSETVRAPRSSRVVGGRFDYPVAAGDSLSLVGARFGVDPLTLARENGLETSAWLRVGQHLSIDNRHVVPLGPGDGILVNIPQRMLFRFAGGELREHFPVGLGRPTWKTPLGPFTVREREQDKTWHIPPSIQREMRQLGTFRTSDVSPGPDNPLGRHWIGLSIPSIGIHGTIAPASIYHFQTHGCIRLHPDAAAELYQSVRIGDPGEISYQPVLLARTPDGRILLEVHPDVYRRAEDPMAAARALAQESGLAADIDWNALGAVVHEQAGVAREVQLGDLRAPSGK